MHREKDVRGREIQKFFRRFSFAYCPSIKSAFAKSFNLLKAPIAPFSAQSREILFLGPYKIVFLLSFTRLRRLLGRFPPHLCPTALDGDNAIHIRQGTFLMAFSGKQYMKCTLFHGHCSVHFTINFYFKFNTLSFRNSCGISLWRAP